MTVVAVAGGPPALALVFTALTSASSVVYPPAAAATIPSLVDEDDLAAANALNGTIEQLVVIVGPAIGAVLLLLGSPAPCSPSMRSASRSLRCSSRASASAAGPST